MQRRFENHYLAGPRPFKLEDYRRWLKLPGVHRRGAEDAEKDDDRRNVAFQREEELVGAGGDAWRRGRDGDVTET
jgi:hypothetical protein